jgi:hypothetical protein
MRIARSTPNQPDKSTLLPIDWEDISLRGINTTNYALLPGDRLVIYEDPLTLQSNLVNNKTAPVERVMGITSCTTSSVGGLNSNPAAEAVVKQLVQKGYFTDDEELKRIVLDAMRLRAAESVK